MKKKGSVTVFFSLFMAVFLILIQVMFHSVQIAGGRVQAEAGVEEGLYSVFACVFSGWRIWERNASARLYVSDSGGKYQ